MTLLLAALLLAAPATAEATREPSAQAPPHPGPPDVHQLHLAIDIPVTLVAASVPLARQLFESASVRRTCPCDPSGINPIDRG